jgi:hypothetical protein
MPPAYSHGMLSPICFLMYYINNEKKEDFLFLSKNTMKNKYCRLYFIQMFKNYYIDFKREKESFFSFTFSFLNEEEGWQFW